MTGSLRKTAAHNWACGASRQIDSRWGEKYFAEHLNDFDLAANNGGWQWAASTGCDAQPYFRIFIPVTQSEKFDLNGKFIRRYLPELGGLSGAAIHAPWLAGSVDIASAGITLGKQYPKPIWEHAAARTTALAMYGLAKKKKSRQANNERWSLIRSKSTNGQIR